MKKIIHTEKYPAGQQGKGTIVILVFDDFTTETYEYKPELDGKAASSLEEALERVKASAKFIAKP